MAQSASITYDDLNLLVQVADRTWTAINAATEKTFGTEGIKSAASGVLVAAFIAAGACIEDDPVALEDGMRSFNQGLALFKAPFRLTLPAANAAGDNLRRDDVRLTSDMYEAVNAAIAVLYAAAATDNPKAYKSGPLACMGVNVLSQIAADVREHYSLEALQFTLGKMVELNLQEAAGTA